MGKHMSNPQKLYNLLREQPTLTNQEIMEKLHWSSLLVRKNKYLLKQRGCIAVDADDGVIILKEYDTKKESMEARSFKQEAYRHLYDICIARAESEEITTPQLISLVQEIRLILNRME